MWNGLEERCRELFPKAGYCSFRLVREKKESLSVRRDVLQPVASSENLGAMVTVVQGGGMGYGATCDLTKKGLARAVEDAAAWARVCARHGAVDYSRIVFPRSQGEYETPTQVAWSEVPLREKVELPHWINGGVYVFSRDIESSLPELGDHEVSSFPDLAAEGKLAVLRSRAFWRSVDSFKDLQEAEAYLKGKGW